MNKKIKLSFSELDQDIKKKYINQFVWGGIFLIGFLFLMITTKMYREFSILAALVLFYIAYIGIDLFDTLKNARFFVFTGSCKQITKPSYDIAFKKVYGEAKMVLESNGTQCVVSVPRSFEVTENDTVTIISKESETYFDGTFFRVTKALSVKLQKYA